MAEERSWSVEFYQDGRGRRPVEEFIEGLPERIRSKVYRDLDAPELFGTNLSMPIARPISGYRFSELRTQLGRDIVRIFFFGAQSRRIILLHGFVKKTQRTPRAELDTAASRREAFLRS